MLPQCHNLTVALQHCKMVMFSVMIKYKPINLVLICCLLLCLQGTMLFRAFRAHGRLCASHPWEMIIGTVVLLVSIMSMTVFTSTPVCGWNYKCTEDDNTVSLQVTEEM